MTMTSRFYLSLVLPVAILSTAHASAQTSTTTTRRTVIESHTTTGKPSSTTTTVEQSGVMGVKSANKVNYKYKERLKNYVEQVDMGLTRGWLTADDGAKFKKELERLNALEATVSKNGYVKAEVDNLEKQVTKFNMDLTAAANKKPGTASAGTKPATAATAGAKPATASGAKTSTPAAVKTAAPATKPTTVSGGKTPATSPATATKTTSASGDKASSATATRTTTASGSKPATTPSKK